VQAKEEHGKRLALLWLRRVKLIRCRGRVRAPRRWGSTFTQAMADETMTSATMNAACVRSTRLSSVEREREHEEEDGAGDFGHHAEAKKRFVARRLGGRGGVAPHNQLARQ